MNSADWQRLENLFQNAADLPIEDRPAFLDRLGPESDTVRREVELLLGAHEAEPQFLARPLFEELVRGLRIGPYEVLEELGRGGMGTVYLARRADSREAEKVAVKVLHSAVGDEFGVGRFLQERTILATLDHPNIARFHDGGVTDDGRPYLAMEYLEGEPIDRYCDRRRLPIRDRLELFLEVCGAIGYAHRKLIIHRDLKPSNILVTRHGVPKILDFGIAKLHDPALRHPAVSSTALGMALMTPAYASPEQILGQPITTATDVYGLGALLYELLSGHPLHRLSGAHPAEVVYAVCEHEPEVPSLRIGAPPAHDLAEHRSTHPARLRRQLEGDLDKILLKTLRKEPERRYGSVDGLAADLKRHLSGRPVLASRGSLAYRVRKFASRHPASVAAAAVALMSILIFGGSLLRQVAESEQQRHRAERERARAEQISSFLVDLFQQTEADKTSDHAAGARELLDRGAERIRQDWGQRPELRAHLLVALGQGYSQTGHYDDAEKALLEALDIQTERLGLDHLDTADTLHELGLLRLLLDQYDEAERLLERARAIREAELGDSHPSVGRSLAGLTKLHRYRGHYDQAESLARQALAILRAEARSDPLAVSDSLHDLAVIVREQGDYTSAVGLFEESLELRRQTLGDEHTQVAISLQSLGLTLLRLGDTERAETHLARSLRISEKNLGKVHPSVVASQQNLAAVFREKGDYRKAEALYLEALASTRTMVGAEHRRVATLTYNLGYLYYAEGDLARAEQLMREALEIQESSLGAEHPFVSFTVHYLGAIARQRGDFEAAERLIARALKIRRAAYPGDNPNLATSLHELGRLHRDRQQLLEADKVLREALRIRESTLGPEHKLVASTLGDLAEVAQDLGHLDRARDLLERAVRLRATTPGARAS